MERNDLILSLLASHKTMSIQQLCKELFCSPSSLRRDLIKLEKTGSVRRIRGGVTLVAGTGFDYSSNFRENVNVAEKTYICGIARDFLANGMSLFLDSSSTVVKICPVLDSLSNITVVTNGIGTALILNNCSNVETFITGGHLRHGNATLLGETAGDFTRNFKADLAIVSCRGIDRDGAFEADLEQARIKQHMMQNAKKTILLADSTKFGTHFFHRLCNFSDLQAVISDKAPTPEIELAIESQGCEMLY
ncbi:MAG: DeoR/GlpR family DNA-binding transcription regulator [Oscillospiraceae bacterium]